MTRNEKHNPRGHADKLDMQFSEAYLQEALQNDVEEDQPSDSKTRDIICRLL